MTQRNTWLLLIFMTFLNLLSFADRHMMVSFSNAIIADLQLSHFEFTLLNGLFFTAFYTIPGMFMGVLADTRHRPRLIAAGLALWTSAMTMTGFIKGFLGLAAARAALGVGQASLTPAALSMLNERFHPNLRGLVAALYYLGMPLGAGGCFLLAAALGESLGWRGTYIVVGLAGFVFCIPLLFIREQRPAQPQRVHVGLGFWTHFAEFATVVRRSPALMLTYLGIIFALLPQGATMLDQVWLVQERGYTNEQAQTLMGGIFLTGGTVGALLGGVMGDWFHRRRAGGRLFFLALVYCLAAPAGIVYRFADPNSPLFYAAFFVSAAAIMMPFGPCMASVQALSPQHLRSTAVALMILCMTFFAYAPGGAMAGALSDWLQVLAVPQPITTALTVGMLPGLLAIPTFYMASRYAQRDTASARL